MAVLFGAQMTKLRVTPVSTPDPGFVDGTVRSFLEVVTYATQTTSDTIEVARLPRGATLLAARIMTSVTTSTATMAFGITGTTGKYRAAATFTTTDTWEELDVATTAWHATNLTAEEIVFITIGTASLPGSGTLLVQFTYAFN